jgi:hypothetical protein
MFLSGTSFDFHGLFLLHNRPVFFFGGLNLPALNLPIARVVSWLKFQKSRYHYNRFMVCESRKIRV